MDGRLVGAAALLVLGGCKSAPSDPPAASSGPTPSASAPAPAPTRTAPPPAVASASSAVADAVGSSAVAASGEAGAGDAAALSPGACRVVRGPVEMPVRSPAALSLRGDSLDVVLDEDGKPRTVTLAAAAMPAAPAPAPAAREAAEGGSVPGISVPCAVAGDRIYCPDRTGGVHRVARAGGEERVVASSRTGTRVGAATLGAHAAVAYVASRKTTEGWLSEAWIAVDDDPPVRVSEDGSGATSLGLLARGAGVLAYSVDARSALTALHVRPVAYEHGAKLGEDTVIFVAGPGDRRTGAALVAAEHGPSWALLPIAKDVGTFGLAVVRLDDPPHVDEPVVWSTYPNGLDPAPVAAAASGARTWVARVRPQSSEPSSARILELGDLGDDGAFTQRDVVATSGPPTDASIVADGHGALWVSWVDPQGSWVERLVCKP